VSHHLCKGVETEVCVSFAPCTGPTWIYRVALGRGTRHPRKFRIWHDFLTWASTRLLGILQGQCILCGTSRPSTMMCSSPLQRMLFAATLISLMALARAATVLAATTVRTTSISISTIATTQAVTTHTASIPSTTSRPASGTIATTSSHAGGTNATISSSSGSAAAGATLITTTLSGGGTVVISSTRFANPTVTVVSNGGVTSYHPQYFLYSVSFLLFGICVLYC